MVTVYGNGPNGLDSDDEDPEHRTTRRSTPRVHMANAPAVFQSIHRPATNPRNRMQSNNGFYNGSRATHFRNPTVVNAHNSSVVHRSPAERTAVPDGLHTDLRSNDPTESESTQESGPSTGIVRVSENRRSRASNVSGMHATVNSLEDRNRRHNTALAYDNKLLELKLYCDAYFSPVSVENGRYRVTHEKVYSFMYYQAFRSSRNGRKRKRMSPVVFDQEDFETTMTKYNGFVTEAPLPPIEDPLNGLGGSAFVQYRCTIWNYHKRQVENGVNNTDWRMIWTEACEKLLRMVKSRKRRVRKRNFHEKIDHETSHYVASDQIERIEEYFFSLGHATNVRSVFSSLRNRFTFLMTTHGILRGESLFKCELSDLFGVTTHKKDVDPHPCYVLMMHIATGKTNGYIKLYGRVCRHKDAKLCAIGALGMYLLYRFEKTREFAPPPDFTDNSNWFDWKLLTDFQRGPDNFYSKELKNISYTKAIKDACNRLQIPTHHFAHIGRVLGHHAGEENEDNQEDLRILGNWDPSTQDKYYSKQMPMKIIKSRGGFVKADHYHFNPRTAVIPSIELQRMIFPWIEEAKEKLLENDPQCQRRTAIAFLDLMEKLRIVILQDTAVLIEDDRRSRHKLFWEVEVFSSSLFKDFRDEMRSALSQVTDPTNTALSTVLPGVKERLDTLNHSVLIQSSLLSGCAKGQNELQRRVFETERRLIGDIASLRTGVTYQIQQVNDSVSLLAGKLQNAATAFISAGEHNNTTTRDGRHNCQTGVSHSPYIPPLQTLIAPLTTPADPSNLSPPQPPPNFERFGIPPSWKSFSEVLDFWCGKGDYQDRPVPGGVAAIEEQQKSHWRKKFTRAQSKAFSRLKIVCLSATKLLEDGTVNMQDLEDTFSKHCQRNLCKCEVTFKQKGWYKPVCRPKKRQILE
jgi:hypothetical protein